MRTVTTVALAAFVAAGCEEKESGTATQTTRKLVPVVCEDPFAGTPTVSPFFEAFVDLSVVPTEILSLEDFTVDVTATVRIPRDRLQREMIAAFPTPMDSVDVVAAQAGVVAIGALAGSPMTTVAGGLPVTLAVPQSPNPGEDGGSSCVGDEDCPLAEFGQVCGESFTCECACRPGCTPEACANTVTDGITVDLGTIDQARLRAQPGGEVCFDIDDDVALFSRPNPFLSSILVVTPIGERQIDCWGGTVNDAGTAWMYDDYVDSNSSSDHLCFAIACANPPCNTCPKLTTFTGGPRSFVIFGSVLPYPRAELVFRATDPDRSCGESCAPAHPEGNLVCDVRAASIDFPGGAGQFFDPLDPTVGVGPSLTANLDTLRPGTTLPGLGGVESEPLPPLDFECPEGAHYNIALTISCSDGDSQCDQRGEIVVFCGHTDGCEYSMACRAPNDCLTYGYCDNGCPVECDPSRPEYDPTTCDAVVGVAGASTCSHCPDEEEIPLGQGTPCSSNGGTACDGMGNCL